MLTAVPPINPKAAQAATRSVALRNPDLVNPDGTLKPVDASTARGQAVRQQWMQSYAANGGKAQVVHPPQRQAQVAAARSAARNLPDKPPAQALLRCPGAQHGPVAPPPGSMASRPCQPGNKTCKPLTGTLQCGHGRKASAGHLLEVVPGAAGDTIALGCGASACGKPPVWSISGATQSEKTGSKASFNANRWLMGNNRWAGSAGAKTYRVHVGTECGTRSAEYTVRCYPSDRFSLAINGKAWVELKSKVKYLQEVIIGAFLPNVEMQFLEGKLEVGAGWEEDAGSHLAFYGWKVAGSMDPFIGLKGRFPFGPLATIPQWLKKYGDAYLFVEFSGGLGFVADWGCTAPRKVSGSFRFTGKVGGKIGGSMFFARKTVLVMEVAGASGITMEGEPDFGSHDVPKCRITGKWDGLKAEITIIAARGIIEVKRELKVCDEREFLDGTYAIPLLS